jgi:hypothetical protein
LESVDWIDLAQDSEMAGCCEEGNEPSGSVKCGEFLEQLSNFKLKVAFVLEIIW